MEAVAEIHLIGMKVLTIRRTGRLMLRELLGMMRVVLIRWMRDRHWDIMLGVVVTIMEVVVITM